MKINTICGNGLGTSLILKINVDKILKELNIKANVQATDIGSVKSGDAELLVTTTQFESNLKSIDKDIIYVNNVMDKANLKEQLETYFEAK